MESAYSFETGGSGYDASNPYHLLAYKRYQTSSDLIALVTERSTDNCGIAKAPYSNRDSTKLPSVTAANCSLTFSHEIGHNMGAMHERSNYLTSKLNWRIANGIYPYAFGFKSPGHIRTMMAYSCTSSSCPRINYFSDPNRPYSSKGQTLHLGVTNRSDNSRAIRGRSSQIARISTIRPGLGLQIPQITKQPKKTSSSGSITLTVEARDPNSPQLSLSYQWYRNGQVVSGGNRKKPNITNL